MAKILILYSTVDGHTKKICLKIKSIAERYEHQVKLVSIDDAFLKGLDEFDKIVVGASIRYGKHSKKVFDFVARNEKLLEEKVSAFFSVNVVARKPDKNKAYNNPYVMKFLKRISWKPDEVAVFAGKIDYQKYSFLDRLVIRLIMYITKGPTNSKTVAEFTNWEQVEEFGRTVSEMRRNT